jgi:hypothetical protein
MVVVDLWPVFTAGLRCSAFGSWERMGVNSPCKQFILPLVRLAPALQTPAREQGFEWLGFPIFHPWNTTSCTTCLTGWIAVGESGSLGEIIGILGM